MSTYTIVNHDFDSDVIEMDSSKVGSFLEVMVKACEFEIVIDDENFVLLKDCEGETIELRRSE